MVQKKCLFSILFLLFFSGFTLASEPEKFASCIKAALTEEVLSTTGDFYPINYPLLITKVGRGRSYEGVQIAVVKQGSVLDSAGILPGDCICSVNGSPVDGDGMLFGDVSLCDYLEEESKQGVPVNLGVYRVQTQEKDTIILQKSEHGFSILKE